MRDEPLAEPHDEFAPPALVKTASSRHMSARQLASAGRRRPACALLLTVRTPRHWDALDGGPHVTGPTPRRGARPNRDSGGVAEGRSATAPEARFGRARSPHLIVIAPRTAASRAAGAAAGGVQGRPARLLPPAPSRCCAAAHLRARLPQPAPRAAAAGVSTHAAPAMLCLREPCGPGHLTVLLLLLLLLLLPHAPPSCCSLSLMRLLLLLLLISQGITVPPF